jgi:F-type H+-transporting ATPase subunit epsilon
MAETIEFDLVAPEAVILAQPVEMVVIPGADGDLGVLPRHARTIASLRPGVITVYERQGSAWRPRDRIFVGAGFAEVTPERVTVLAEDAVPLAQLDRTAVEQSLKDAREDLEDAKEELERRAARRAIAVAEAKLVALKG